MGSPPRRLRAIGCRQAIDLVEAGYQLDGPLSSWLDNILTHALPDLDQGDGVIAYTATIGAMAISGNAARNASAGLMEALVRINNSAPPAVRAAFSSGPARGFYSTRDEIAAQSPETKRFWDEHVTPATGFKDSVGILAPGRREALTVWAPCREVVRSPPRVKAMWTNVSTHLAAGLRLREALEPDRVITDAEAVFDVDGKAAELRGPARDASAREALRLAVRRIESARGPMRKKDPEAALSMWQGLVQGRWSLVDYWDHDGRRFFAAHPNAPGVTDPRALRPPEIAALSLAKDGASPKEVAYALGITASNARALLSGGLRKIGMRVVGDLHRIEIPSGEVFELRFEQEATLHVLRAGSRPVAAARLATLTPTERDVAQLVAEGLDNRQIARRRRTSPSTVANQVAAILRKLGLRSRALLPGYFPPQ